MNKKKPDSLPISLAIGSLYLLTFCGGPQLDGSASVYQITSLALTGFSEANPGKKWRARVSDSTTAILKLCSGQLDMAHSSRAMTSLEQSSCVPHIKIPVATDALILVVHKSNPVDSLTLKELQVIFSADNSASSWQEVRSDLKEVPLKVTGVPEYSGTFQFFSAAIQSNGQLRPDAQVSSDFKMIARAVSGDPHSIGLLDFATYEHNKDHLKPVAIDNEKGTLYMPSRQSLESGDYSILTRPLILYVREAALEDPDVVSFLNYYLTHAPELVEQAGFLSHAKLDYEAVREQLHQ